MSTAVHIQVSYMSRICVVCVVGVPYCRYVSVLLRQRVLAYIIIIVQRVRYQGLRMK